MIMRMGRSGYSAPAREGNARNEITAVEANTDARSLLRNVFMLLLMAGAESRQRGAARSKRLVQAPPDAAPVTGTQPLSSPIAPRVASASMRAAS